MRAIALALVISLTAQAQEADVVEVREARIATPANEILDVQGGIYLSPAGSASVAKKIVSQEQQLKTLEAERQHPLVMVAIAVAVALGAGAGGFALARATSK